MFDQFSCDVRHDWMFATPEPLTGLVVVSFRTPAFPLRFRLGYTKTSRRAGLKLVGMYRVGNIRRL